MVSSICPRQILFHLGICQHSELFAKNMIIPEVCCIPWLPTFVALHTGSHDSFSYWVDEKSPVGPDQTAAIKRLARISLVKKLMKKWSVTQNLTFREQLEAGIRYFDLRVSSKPGDADQEIYFIHGLFGIKVWDGLMEIDSFLTQHPQEIVFLDFNHFYAMDEAHHKRLVLRIQEAFGNKLCSACSVESMTLRAPGSCSLGAGAHVPTCKLHERLFVMKRRHKKEEECIKDLPRGLELKGQCSWERLQFPS